MTTKFNLNEWLGRQFDWHGELTRWQFFKIWGSSLLLTLAMLVPFYILMWTFVSNSIDYGLDAAAMMQEDLMTPAVYAGIFIWNWVVMVVLFAMFGIVTMATVKRIAHMGWTRWAVLLGTVPVINFVFLLVLFFWPGKNSVGQ